MTKVNFAKGKNSISNDLGVQAMGSFAAGNEGLNPRELLEAALGLCVSLTLRKLFERDGHLTDETEMAIEVTAIKHEGGDNRFDRFEIKVKMPVGLDAGYKEKALLLAERGCTIGNTLKNVCTVESVEM